MSVDGWVGLGTAALGVVASIALWVLGLERRVVKLETQIEPLWRDVSFAAVQAATSLLHSPENELGLDEYIDRFNAGTLDAQQTQEFRRLLQAVRDVGPTLLKRHAADILLREIDRRA